MNRPTPLVLVARVTFSAMICAVCPSPAQAQTGGLDPEYLTPFGHSIYFSGFHVATGRELWTSDGSALGTVIVKDIRPGTESSSPRGLTIYGNGLFFGANPEQFKSELWKSDGLSEGTTRVTDVFGSESPFTYAGGKLFVGGWITSSCCSDVYLYATDGTEAGTTVSLGLFGGWRLIGLARYIPFSSPLRYKDALYFLANPGLWTSDGTVVGTLPVKGFQQDVWQSVPFELVDAGGTLFFPLTFYTNAGLASQLWKSDGTEAGTVLVKEINPNLGDGLFSSSPRDLTDVGGTLYFAAAEGVNGAELWKSDGTEAGTVLVKDINPGAASSSPSGLANVDGTLYFAAADGVSGAELWKSDGTQAGTVLVKDINPGAASSSPSSLTSIAGRLYFAADDGVSGVEPWTSDGTPGGTVRLADIAAGPGSSIPASFVSTNGIVFFSADDGVHGPTLWRSDGTGVGTIRIEGPPNLTIADASAPEGQAEKSLLAFAVELTGAYPQAVTVDYATSDGTAVAGLDYVASSGTLTFYPGQAQRTILVPVLGDTVVEADRAFNVRLSDVTNATLVDDTAVGTIVDDDPPPASATAAQYRLYSPITYEHLYTTDTNEYAVLGTVGWLQEGLAYTMFKDGGPYGGVSGVPLYRLYHPGVRQHHWTTDWYEVTVLAAGAWDYEGIPGYVLPTAVAGTVPLYRLALAYPPLHLWTTDANEYQVLTTPQRGWIGEGIVGYVLP